MSKILAIYERISKLLALYLLSSYKKSIDFLALRYALKTISLFET